MFKKKFLGILLALFAVVTIPSFALAQTTDDETIYEDTSTDYDYEFDWGEFEDSYEAAEYDYDAEDIAAVGSIFAGLAFVWIAISSVIGIAVYVFSSLAYMKIAKKLNHPNPWFAWIPILNIVLHFQLGGMSGWFVLLMFVPLANIVVYVLAMMKICEKLGKEKLLGLLVLVPLANYILLGILAWGKDESQPVQQAPQQTKEETMPAKPVQQAPQQKKEDEETYLKPQQTPEPPKEE